MKRVNKNAKGKIPTPSEGLEFFCKEKFGKDVYWNPDKLADTIVGLCKSCKLERGKCPNTYIGKDTGDALYCIWYQQKKKKNK